MAQNTKARYQQLHSAALRIVSEFGITRLDALPLRIANAHRREMAERLAHETDCHPETARKRIIDAICSLRDPNYRPLAAGWGGARREKLPDIS